MINIRTREGIVPIPGAPDLRVTLKKHVQEWLAGPMQDIVSAMRLKCLGCGGERIESTSVITSPGPDDTYSEILVIPTCRPNSVCTRRVAQLSHVQDPEQKHMCNGCGEVVRCQRCGRCRGAYYCGRNCQLRDWPEHKKVCQPE